MRGEKWRRLKRVFRAAPADEINEELRFHLERRVADYRSRGMTEDAARTAAERRLGDLGKVRRECADMMAAEQRSDARRYRLGVSWLDFKLGMRMLVKYPGLTLVGGLAMAFAIWVGAGSFEFIRQLVNPALPLPDGDRVVGLVNWDAAASTAERRSLYDLAIWREEARTLSDLGAFRQMERNLIDERGAAPVEIAEISASAFRVARVNPLMGRTLQQADEAPDAEPVAVIGYSLWQTRFGADPDVIGRVIRLGTTRATVVGVMPEGFAFPVAQSLWVPLGMNGDAQTPREGAAVRMFGRLAPGASMGEAQAELAGIAARVAANQPDTHEHLRPRVLPYARSIMGISASDSLILVSINFYLIVLLALICANVALLMFARAATRESELVVRSALGASRGRIVAQLFAEALVLGVLAGAIGLAAAQFGLRWLFGAMEAVFFEGVRPPFWFRPGLSPATVIYVLGLTLLGACIAGVLPALKVTRSLQAGLRRSASGLTVGGVWTFIIVAQVAVTFTFPVVVFFLQKDAARITTADVGFPERDYLTARIEVDRDFAQHASPQASAEEFGARVDELYQRLEQRLVADPAVAAVTFGDRLPRMYHPHRLVDLDEGAAAPLHPDYPAYRISSAHVAPGFFETLQVPLIAGRALQPADIASEEPVILVNESFVERVLGGRNAVGRHVRYRYFEGRHQSDDERAREPWYRIVGVVGNTATVWGDFDPKSAAVFHPAAPQHAYPLNIAIRTQGEPTTFAPHLREIATAIDPALRVYDPMRMDDLSQADVRFMKFWVRITGIVSGIALVLALAGIYAVMSFTVARRTREIGIRVALGSDPRRVVGAIFRHAIIQVMIGLAVGAVITCALLFAASGSFDPRPLPGLFGYTALMTGICALACIAPARRALGVQPMEAMRME